MLTSILQDSRQRRRSAIRQAEEQNSPPTARTELIFDRRKLNRGIEFNHPN
jgi:hypothetical protein